MKRLALLLLLACPCFPQVLQPAPIPVFRAFDRNGLPLVGGQLYSYIAGTTTLTPTFADPGGATPNPNPVTLDSSGSARVYLGSGSYKLILLDVNGVQQWSADNVFSGGHSTTLSYTYPSGGGAHLFVHGLGSNYPIVSCWDAKGSDGVAYRRKTINSTSIQITTAAAGLLTCSFIAGGL